MLYANALRYLITRKFWANGEKWRNYSKAGRVMVALRLQLLFRCSNVIEFEEH